MEGERGLMYFHGSMLWSLFLSQPLSPDTWELRIGEKMDETQGLKAPAGRGDFEPTEPFGLVLPEMHCLQGRGI